MNHYTILNTTAINQIFKSYEVGAIINHQLLQGGSENTNYKIQTTTGDFVLTICEQKPKEEAEHLAQLLNHLNKKAFSTSEIISNKEGHWVSDFNGKPILLKKYLAGIVTADFSDLQMQAVGKQLACLHRIPTLPIIPHTLSYGIEQFSKVQEVAPTSSFNNWLMDTKKYIAEYRKEGLPKCLIHADLFYNNIITNPKTNEVTVMDFEEAAYYYRVYDIGMTLIGTCAIEGKLNLKKAYHLLHAYQQHQTLTQQEQQALQAFTVYSATATAFWRFMNFNFVRPDEAHKDRYREMQALAIQVRSISEEEFLSLL